MKLQIVLSFKMLLTNVALVIRFENSFVAELLQMLLKHSKIVQSALVSVLQHLNTISFKNRFYLGFYSVNHVLRVEPRAIVVLERLAERRVACSRAEYKEE